MHASFAQAPVTQSASQLPEPHVSSTSSHACASQSRSQSVGEHWTCAGAPGEPQLSGPEQRTSHAVAIEQSTPSAQLEAPSHSTRQGMFAGHTIVCGQLMSSSHSKTHTPVWHSPPAATHASSWQRGIMVVPPLPPVGIVPPVAAVEAPVPAPAPPSPVVDAPPPVPAVSSGGMQAESAAAARTATTSERGGSMRPGYIIRRVARRRRPCAGARRLLPFRPPVPLPDVLYQPFYCEENVHHLLRHAALAGRPRHAVVVSGVLGGFVMWHQRAARGRSAPLFWDYHVIVLAEDPWEVWDLDTTLGVPSPAPEYLRRSFRAGLPPELAPIFRVVPAGVFVATFASDRSHMRRPDGRFERPPPPWPTVSPPERGSNLRRFVDMTDPFVGEVLSLEDLSARIGGGASR